MSGILSTQAAALQAAIAGLVDQDVSNIDKAGGFLTAGTRFVRIGGSTTARDSCIVKSNAGNVTGDGRKLTITALSDQLLSDGQIVHVACQTPSTAFDYVWAHGPITMETATRFTMAYDGVAGTSSQDFSIHMQARYSVNSLWRELQALYKGALELVGNYSCGSTNTLLLSRRLPEIVSLKPHFVFGSLGVGNLQLGGVSAADSIAATIGFVSYLTSRGIRVILELPLGTTAADGAVQAWANQVYRALYKYAELDRLFAIVDPTSWSVVPSTGLANTAYLVASDPVHHNRAGQERYAQDLFNLLKSIVPVPVTSPLSQSILDRRSANAGCTNIFNGMWSNAGLVTASTIETGSGSASGSVIPEVTLITTNGGGTVAACSVAARTTGADGDDCGYNQVVDFTFTANNNAINLEFTGVGNDMAAAVRAAQLASAGTSKRYRVYAMLEISTSNSNLKSVELIVSGQGCTYQGGAQANKTIIFGAAMSNDTNVPDNGVTKSYKTLMCTEDLIIPKDLTAMTKFIVNLGMKASGACTGTVKLGRLTVREVN